MHQIFRSASYTIVAALNERDAPGLPGFASRPRVSSVHNPMVHFNQPDFILKRGFEKVDVSLWNRRGWTFQERLLSTRRIYITEHEVQYECCLGYASEIATHSDPYKKMRSPCHSRKHSTGQLPGFSVWSQDSTINKFRMNDRTTILDYMEWVEDYTSRELSYDSDILNAFAGVEGLLKETLDSSFHYGLPEKYLHIALMWTPNNEIVPRTTGLSVPSWSWASVATSSTYYWLSLNSSDNLGVINLVYFHYQHPQDGLQKLNVEEWWPDEKISLDDFRNEDDMPTESQTRLYTWRATHDRIWRECPQSPSQMLQRQALDHESCRLAASLPGCLVFNTTVASIKVRKYHNKSTGEHIGEFDNTDAMEILYDDDKHLGQLYSFSPHWQERIDGSGCWNGDIIVMSGAYIDLMTRNIMRMRGCWNGEQEDADTMWNMWRLRVTLIDRDSSQPRMARRVAVGNVFVHLWKFCKPRWETIVLC